MTEGILANNSMIAFKTFPIFLGAIFEMNSAVRIEIGTAISRANKVTRVSKICCPSYKLPKVYFYFHSINFVSLDKWAKTFVDDKAYYY